MTSILVIDDDADVRDSIAGFLVRHGVSPTLDGALQCV
jgi:CheY-like chemotaxis protein